jgi:hypothetical protein
VQSALGVASLAGDTNASSCNENLFIRLMSNRTGYPASSGLLFCIYSRRARQFSQHRIRVVDDIYQLEWCFECLAIFPILIHSQSGVFLLLSFHLFTSLYVLGRLPSEMPRLIGLGGVITMIPLDRITIFDISEDLLGHFMVNIP